MDNDKPWTEFSILDVGVLVFAMQLHSQQKQPNLILKIWPKLLLGYKLLAFMLSNAVDTTVYLNIGIIFIT